MARRRLPGQGRGRSVERRVFLCLRIGLMAGLLAGCADQARAQVQHHAGHALGTVHFPVTCSEQAQVEFDRAMALLHHMTYPQAREAFERVITTDPRCAMAHWGYAMTLFQPLWPTRPGPDALQRGWEAVQKAKALEPATERERAFVAAAEAFFLEPGSTDYWLRIRRWEQEMEKAHASFPDDPEASAFYALAHLATTPSKPSPGSMPTGPRRSSCASTRATPITRGPCTISSTRTMCRGASGSCWRSPASTSRWLRAILTRSNTRTGAAKTYKNGRYCGGNEIGAF